MKNCLIAVFLSGCVMASAAHAGETIFVDASVAASGDGSSWAEAFKTITEARDRLTVVNAASQGGHTIKVAAGDYAESVSFSEGEHSGTAEAPNTLLGVGTPWFTK